MKFIVKSHELAKKTKTIVRGHDPKDESSFVAFSLKKSEGDYYLELISRSRTSFFRAILNVTNVEITEGEPLTYYVNGDTLRQLSSVFPTAPIDVTFSITDITRSFGITYEGSALRLPVIKDTSPVDTPEVLPVFSANAREIIPVMRDLLRLVVTDSDSQEHQSSCMHFDYKDSTVALNATDTFAIASINVSAAKLDDIDKHEVLVRHSQVSSLIGTFGDNEVLNFCTVDNGSMFGYTDEDGTLLLVGVASLAPLDLMSVISDWLSDDYAITVNKDELKTAIDIVSKLSFNDNFVSFDTTPESTILNVRNRMGDKVEVELLENTTQDNFKVNYVTNVLLNAMGPVSTRRIRFEFDDSPQVIKIVPLLDNGSALESATICATVLDSDED